MVAGVLCGVVTALSLRRARVPRWFKAGVTVAFYLLVYAAAERWGPVIPMVVVVAVWAAIRVIDIRRYPYFACGACEGKGKFSSSLSTAMSLCAACKGSGRQERRGVRLLAALGMAD